MLQATTICERSVKDESTNTFAYLLFFGTAESGDNSVGLLLRGVSFTCKSSPNRFNSNSITILSICSC